MADVIIRPTPSGAPTPSPRPQESLEDLARDVLETGVEIRAPRKWWFGTKALDAGKAAEQIRKQNPDLTVRQPGHPDPLPVRSEQDLRELAVFHQARPLSQLEHPELGQAVVTLEEAGFDLTDEHNRPLSLYGAYNAVTDPGMQLGPLQVNLAQHGYSADATNLSELAAFYHPANGNVLGRLEIGGYQFYDQRGQRRFAYGMTPPATVGLDGESWLPANRPDLERRLEEFAVLREETGDLSKAQQLAGLEAKNFVTQAASLSRDPKALPGLLRAAGKLPDDRLVEAGLKLDLTSEGRQGWLYLLQERPEQAPLAHFAERMGLFQEVLEKPAPTTGLEAARVAQQLEKQSRWPEATLELLGRFPDTRAAAEAVSAWKSTDPALIADLLADPANASDQRLEALALAHARPGQQSAVLQERSAHSVRARLSLAAFPGVDGSTLKNELFQLALTTKEPTTGAEAAQTARAALQVVKRSRIQQRTGDLARATLEVLAGFPDTRELAETVQSWELAHPEMLLSSLLSDPRPEALPALMVQIQNDAEAQRKRLEALDEPAREVGLKLFEASKNAETRNAVYHAALDHSGLTDGRGVGRLVLQLNLSSAREKALLAPVALSLLQEFPDTRAAADQVAAWQSQSLYPLVQALAGDLDLRRVAAACDKSDRSGQEQILAWLGHKPAQESLGRMQTEEGRAAVLKTALAQPDSLEFYRSLAQGCPAGERERVGAQVLSSLEGEAARRVEAWKPRAPYALAQALLRRPTDASPEHLRQLAALVADTPAQQRVLEELKADPATARVGEVALELYAGLASNGKSELYKSALEMAEASTGAQLAAMLARFGARLSAGSDRRKGEDQQLYGQQVPAILARFPDTKEAAEAVIAWQAARPFSLAMALAKAPQDVSREGLNRLATQADESDLPLLKRILEQRPCPATSAGLVLLGKANDLRTRRSILENVLGRLEASTTPELVDLLRSIQPRDDVREQARATLEVLESLPETSQAATVVKGWNSARPEALVKKLLQDPTPAALPGVALAVETSDTNGQRGILTWLGDRSGAQIGRELFEQLRTQSVRGTLTRGVLRHAEVKDGAELAGVLRECLGAWGSERQEAQLQDQAVVAKAALERLAAFPDTESAARALAGWEMSQPLPVVKKWLEKPGDHSPEALRGLARQLAASDRAPQQKVLEQMGGPAGEVGLQLLQAASSSDTRLAVLRSVLDRHDLSTGAEVAAMMRGLDEKLLPQGLDLLQRFPDTRPAAARVAGWQPSKPGAMVKKLIENPTDASPANLRLVAARAQESTREFFQGVLNGLAEPANRELGLRGLGQLEGAPAWQAWNAAVLESPPVTNGVEAAALVRRCWNGMKDQRGANRSQLAAVASELLARYPDTEAAAKRYVGWGGQSPAEKTLELWLSDPTFSRPDALAAAAAACSTGDQTMQAALLDELGQQHRTTALMARAAQAEVRTAAAREAIFRTALSFGEVRGTEDVKKFFEQVKSRSREERGRLDELCKLYEMSFGLQGRSADTLAEEQDRLLVGGVVVRKKAEPS